SRQEDRRPSSWQRDQPGSWSTRRSIWRSAARRSRAYTRARRRPSSRHGHRRGLRMGWANIRQSLRRRPRHHRRAMERTPLLRPRPRRDTSGRTKCQRAGSRRAARLAQILPRRRQPMTASVRCAIYTRVSTDAGLEQDFNSLDAQRESAEAFIKSQAHEGWRLVRERFDDGGYSGGSMERPALQRLLDRIRERRIDVIVVYKVDRLTRSLADFAKLVEAFDAHSVAFVSVTHSSNTTTSMGRLTLNVLLSFAQFEREVTGERIRDKIAASKKKGLWMGGVVPLGYRLSERKLHVDEEEAAIVRLIFDLYLELGSVRALQRALRRRNIRTRVRTLATGKFIVSVPVTTGPLAHILRNRHYLGEINHRGQSWPGEHAALVDE